LACRYLLPSVAVVFLPSLLANMPRPPCLRSLESCSPLCCRHDTCHLRYGQVSAGALFAVALNKASSDFADGFYKDVLPRVNLCNVKPFSAYHAKISQGMECHPEWPGYKQDGMRASTRPAELLIVPRLLQADDTRLHTQAPCPWVWC